MSYRVDDAHGNAHTAGLSEPEARRVAQRIADRHGETVYLYEAREGAELEPIVPRGRALGRLLP